MNNTPFIFEGKMIETDYKTKDETYFRSYLFEIKKVYRGKENLKEGTIEIDYESNVLGKPFKKNIADLNPQELWITTGSSFQNQSVYSVHVSNASNDVIAINLQCIDGVTGLTGISTSNTVLFHVKMQINSSNKENTDLIFLNYGKSGAANGTYSYYNTSSTADIMSITKYKPTNYLPSKTANVLLSPSPIIQSYYINSSGNTSGEAGTGDILTINGNYFGDKLPVPTSTISFRLADYKKNN